MLLYLLLAAARVALANTLPQYNKPKMACLTRMVLYLLLTAAAHVALANALPHLKKL